MKTVIFLSALVSYLALYFCFVLLLVFVLLSLSVLGLDSVTFPDSISSYECGFEPVGHSYSRFCIKFFLLAIIYIIFDIEVAFLVPGLFISCLALSFTLILILGLFYEYGYGGLDWVA